MNGNAYIPATNGGIDFYYLFSILEYDYIPIVFVAKDHRQSYYLCDCVECRDMQRWTISQTSLPTILSVIDGRLSVYDALKKNSEVIIATLDYISGQYKQEKAVFSHLSAEYLPDVESYIRYPEPDAKENCVALMESRDQIVYSIMGFSKTNDQWYSVSAMDTDFRLDSLIAGSFSLSHFNDQQSQEFKADSIVFRTGENIASGIIYRKGKDNSFTEDRPSSPYAA